MTKKSAPPVILLWGEDAFLLREAGLAFLGDVQPLEVDAEDWRGGETGDLVTPSLFGERRALLVTECRSLPDHGVKELKQYLQSPSPDAALVLLARVGERGKAPATLAKLVVPVGEVREVNVARKELAGWVGGRANAKGVDITGPGSNALVVAVGEDPAELDQALDQLANAFPGARITPELVAQQFKGLGEQRVWDLCDRAFERNLSGSIRSLRSLMSARADPIMILGGISARVRDLLKVRSLPDSTSPTEVARAAGLRFDWQGRRYREQASRFSMQELTGIHAALVEADRSLKLGADGDVVLSSLVTKIAG
ncbi:MAG: DNA polymerase III subunit delta [Actinomycetota bacterium]